MATFISPDIFPGILKGTDPVYPEWGDKCEDHRDVERLPTKRGLIMCVSHKPIFIFHFQKCPEFLNHHLVSFFKKANTHAHTNRQTHTQTNTHTFVVIKNTILSLSAEGWTRNQMYQM